MKGWTADGTEVELTGDLEQAVRAMLAGQQVSRPRMGGKTIIAATAERYLREAVSDTHMCGLSA